MTVTSATPRSPTRSTCSTRPSPALSPARRPTPASRSPSPATDRFYNDTWHRDGASSKYRKQTRQGGANALNIWLVDFNYLGIATFPWDYSRNSGIDGIRVHYASLPGG